jgi:RuvB-like protein 1
MSVQKIPLGFHSHIKGLGLDPNYSPVSNSNSSGFIGQDNTRKELGNIVKLIKLKGDYPNRPILITGGPASGKSALGHALKQELGSKIPFAKAVPAELNFFGEDALITFCRRTIGLKIKETKDVFEGEVTELVVHEVPLAPPDNSESSYKAISHISLTLKTAKGTKQLDLDAMMYDNLIKSQISIGDIVYFEANSGAIKRLGKSDAYKHVYDLEFDTFLPLPKGEVRTQREVIQELNLIDLDIAAADPEFGNDLISQAAKVALSHVPRRIEITDAIRRKVDDMVDGLLSDEQDAAELVPGVLFIDDAHLLDPKIWLSILRLIRLRTCPVIVMAANNNIYQKVDNSIIEQCHLVKTTDYSLEDLREIIRVRSKTEQIPLEDVSLAELSKLAHGVNLNYALNLLTFLKAMLNSTKTATITLKMTQEACSIAPPLSSQ